jgi:hypothetical protein
MNNKINCEENFNIWHPWSETRIQVPVSCRMCIYERAENTESVYNFLPNGVLGSLMVNDEFFQKFI